MSIIISPALSPPSSAPATMVPSVTEMATAAADLATGGMAMAAERVATTVFRDAIYIIRCRWVAANPRMAGGRSEGCRNGADRDRCVTSSSIKDRWMVAESLWIWIAFDRDLDKNNDDGQKIFRFLVFIQNLMLLLQLTRL